VAPQQLAEGGVTNLKDAGECTRRARSLQVPGTYCDFGVDGVLAAQNHQETGSWDAGVAKMLRVGGIAGDHCGSSAPGGLDVGIGRVDFDHDNPPPGAVALAGQQQTHAAKTADDDVVASESQGQLLHLIAEEGGQRQNGGVPGHQREQHASHDKLPRDGSSNVPRLNGDQLQHQVCEIPR
jgi:hypothetical protein